MNPRVSALLDQADAAAAHGARMFAMLAERANTPVRCITGPEDVSDIIRAIILRFTDRAANGQVTLCSHLSELSPEPVVWLAWAPGRVRCAQCAGAASHRIKGTTEDRRCDHCHRISRVIHPEAMQLPAVVVDLPGLFAASGPVTIMFGLCPDCHARALPPLVNVGRAAV